MKSASLQNKQNFVLINVISKKKCILDYIHSDLWSPTRTNIFSNYTYFLSFTDDFSRYCWTFLLKSKTDVFEKSKTWKVLVENEKGTKIKCFTTDNGLEFCNESFQCFYEENVIERHRTNRFNP